MRTVTVLSEACSRRKLSNNESRNIAGIERERNKIKKL